MGAPTTIPGAYPPGVSFTPVKAANDSEALTIRVKEPYHPHNVRGTVWRYELDATRTNWINGTNVGEFTPFLPTVPIGGPSAAEERLFLILGTVIAQEDNPPAPYQVIVSVLQGQIELSHEVPSDNGSGRIGSTNQIFVYRFMVTS